MSESNPYLFRTAVGGFHKGDVSSYIAKTAAAHSAQVAELEARLEALEQENQELWLRLSENPPVPEMEPAPAADASLEAQELTAYRRAEAAERLACQRAKKLYTDMQHICDSAQQQLDSADAASKAAMSAMETQLNAIRETVSGLYRDIRSNAQALRAMGQMVPDPAEGLEED